MMMAQETSEWHLFYPSDRQLINDFLKPKVMGQQLPFDIIKPRQVYGPSSNPWRVFDPTDHDSSWLKYPHLKSTEKSMFVFAELSKISRSTTSKNTSKKAGCGTWVAKTKRDRIKDKEGNLIGEKRYLVFEINEADSAEAGVGFYGMQEYSLAGINEGFHSADTTVICRVNYDSSKKAAISRKAGAKIADHVSGSSSEVRNKEGINKNLQVVTAGNMNVLNGGVGDCFSPISGVTAENLNVLDGGYCFAPTSNVLDGGVDDWSAITEFHNDIEGLFDFSDDFSFDDHDVGVDVWFDDNDKNQLIAYMDSNQDQKPLQDNIINLGKRKFESEESSNQPKKICFDSSYQEK